MGFGFVHLAEKVMDAFALPGPFLLANYPINLLLIIAIVGGVLGVFAIGVLLYLWRSSRKQVRMAKATEIGAEMAQESLKTTLEASRIGTWNLDLESNNLVLDEIAAHMIGEKIGFTTTISQYTEWVYPEDRERFQQKLQEGIERKEKIHFNFRLFRPEKKIFYVTFWGRIICDSLRRPIQVDALIWDITASWLHQTRLGALVEITTLLNQENHFFKAVEKMLQGLRRSLGWEIMAIWRLNQKSGRFECISVMEDVSGQFPHFLTALKELRIENREKTLASLVLKTNKPACSKNIGKENYFM